MLLHFVEELESIKMGFGPAEMNTQLKEMVTEFIDVTHEPQGLLPRRETSDHKIMLTAYPKRQRRSRMFVFDYN